MQKVILSISLFLVLSLSAFGQDGKPSDQQPPAQSLESVVAEQSELNLAMTADLASRVTLLTTFIKAHPQSAMLAKARQALVQTYAAIGNEYLQNGNLDKGVESFKASFDAIPEPMSDDYFQQLVWNFPALVANAGHREEAVKLMRSFEPRLWSNATRLMEISGFYASVEDAPDALRVLERAGVLAPKDARVHANMGTVYVMTFDFEKSEKEFLTAIELDPKSESVYTILGHLSRAKGDYQKAAEYYSKQIELSPEDDQAHGGLAIADLALGKTTEAAGEGSRTILKNQNDFRFRTQLAYWYALQRDYDKATTWAQAALQIEPRYPWARVVLANAYMAHGRFSDAEKEMVAARKYGQFPSIMFEMGRLYARAGLFDDAVETWTEGFEVTPMGMFRTSVGGTYPIASNSIDQLIERERQATLYFKEPLASKSEIQIAEELLRFNHHFLTLSQRRDFDAIPRYIPSKTSAEQPADSSSSATTSASTSAAAKGDTQPSGAPVIVQPQLSDAPVLNPDYVFYENWQTRMAFQHIDGEVAALNSLDDDRRIFRLIWMANKLTDADLKIDLAISAARLAYDTIDTTALPQNSIRDVEGTFSAEQQQALVKARTEDALGWALFKIDKGELAATYLKAAAERSPVEKERKEFYWHYGSVMETAGKTSEAVELYCKGYDSSSALAAVRRSVIERLYQKVHGSLEGLNEKIGSK